jgi:hypothetical protein
MKAIVSLWLPKLRKYAEVGTEDRFIIEGKSLRSLHRKARSAAGPGTRYRLEVFRNGDNIAIQEKPNRVEFSQ